MSPQVMHLSSANREEKVNSLDLMRIAGCLLVLLLHIGLILKDNAFGSLIRSLSKMQGVTIFFALSGLLALESLDRSTSAAHFYKKRIIRIVPEYYFILLILMLFYTLPKDAFHLGWFRYFLFINDIIPSEHAYLKNIGAFWSIPSFMMFYLIAPFYKKIIKSFSRSIVFFFFSFVISILLTQYVMNPINLYYNGYENRSWVSTLPIFFYGSIAYYAKRENRIEEFLLLTIILLWVQISYGISAYKFHGIAAAGIIAAIRDMPLPKVLERCKLLKAMANVSFTVYLVHWFVLNKLTALNLSDELLLVILFFFLSFVFAYIIHFFVDCLIQLFIKQTIK